MATYAEASQQRRRISWLNLSLLLVGLTLTARLFDIQVLHHSNYALEATVEHNRKYEVPATRGQIYALDGDNKTPLVLNQTLKVVYADARLVSDKVTAARQIAAVTGQSQTDLYKKLVTDEPYVTLATRLPMDVGEKVTALKLTGVGVVDRQYRVYPEGALASQLLGFVNADGNGQYGIEGYLNDSLAGTPGILNAKTDTQGNPIATADNYSKAPVNGKSYVLTIDRNIQAVAEKNLASGVQSVGAKSGSIIIMDPYTGAIKAMANYPTYDPNNYSSVTDYSLFSNAAVADSFEPGSGFKVITMSAGLDSSKVTPDTTYDDTGPVTIDGRQINNAENHHDGPKTNMTIVIRDSLNTGAIFVLKSLGGDPNLINAAGKKLFYDYIKRFGFGVATGVEQAGEASGSVNPSSSNNVNYANMTFGQGLSVTLLQMITAVSAIANGGKLYQPHLVDQVINQDGTAHTVSPRLVNDHVLSPSAAAAMANMMIQVVQHGSGWKAKMPGYSVAGKTGTAQIPRPDGQGYIDGENIGSFVGFAPVSHPRFIMMVRINSPKVPGFAESTTVPVFATVANWLVQYYGVPPQA